VKNDPWQTFYAIKDLPTPPLPSSISKESLKIIEMLLEKDPQKRLDA
jgi:serine/threonine protein kinase